MALKKIQLENYYANKKVLEEERNKKQKERVVIHIDHESL